MWSTAKYWLHHKWWGISITYLTTVLLVYVMTWTLIEPLNIPDKVPAARDLLLRRSVFHILFALMVGSHITLIIEFLRRRSIWHQAAAVNTQTSQDAPEVLNETELPANAAQTNANFGELKTRLESYESLEKEIIGVLASGIEINPNNLSNHLSIGDHTDSNRRIRLAIANLLEMGRIEGTGGLVPSLRLAPPKIDRN